MSAAPALGDPAVRALHATRRRRRVQQVEWFEAAYRVYLTGGVSVAVVLLLSSWLGGEELSASAVDDVQRLAPALLGLLAAAALAVGLRSGSRGGPLAVEAAEVRHVLLAPVTRRRALLGPATRQLRHAAFVGAVAGAVAGQLAARRLPGTTASWVAAVAATGLLVGLSLVGSALVASGLRVPTWLATSFAVALLAWAAADVAGIVPAPTTAITGIALWPLEVAWIDLAGVAVVAALVAVGLVVLGRQSVEAMERRSTLVGQLRFAVTTQDLRTVLVLRRQLAQDRPRDRPWLHVPGRGRFAVWRRDWQGIARFPLARLGRLVVLAGLAGAALAGTYDGSRALAVLATLALFVAGLDVIEPLSQEIDQADRADTLPRTRGELLVRHTAASATLAGVLGLVVTAVFALFERHTDAVAVAAVTGALAALAGAAGAAVSVGMGAPDPTGGTDQLLPPEVAGMKVVLRTVWPLVLAATGTLPTLLASFAVERDDDPVAAATRGMFLPLAALAVTGLWLRHGDEAKAWWRAQLEAGRVVSEAKAADRSARRSGT